jgi:hypothetical protein
LVARIKAHVREELSRLPDYACLETIARFHKPAQRASKMIRLDTVRLEVLYSGDREWYGSPGDISLHELNPKELIGSGIIANGPFALFLRMIFLGHEASFKYRGEEFLGVRKTAKFDFRLPALLSGPGGGTSRRSITRPLDRFDPWGLECPIFRLTASASLISRRVRVWGDLDGE